MTDTDASSLGLGLDLSPITVRCAHPAILIFIFNIVLIGEIQHAKQEASDGVAMSTFTIAH